MIPPEVRLFLVRTTLGLLDPNRGVEKKKKRRGGEESDLR